MSKEKIFCMECKKELTGSENLEQCECGSRNFIFGNVVVTDKGFACSCGSTKLRRVGNMMMNPNYFDEFECAECGAGITTVVYYESPYLDD